MASFDEALAAYRTRIGQLLDAKRSYERRAEEYAQEAALLDARIKGLMEAKELLSAEALGRSEAVEVIYAPRRRQRSLTGHWQQIMQLVDGDDGFGYDDLAEAVASVGHDANRDTLRSQMSLYKNGGLVESKGDGRFRLTEAGRRAAGIAGDQSPNENGPVSAGSDDRDGGGTNSPAPDFEPQTNH
ncbi:hypothetical protein [Sphingomonas sp.]|jgi:hypothetical protein|uniref:hypothetical protein n=1 Tax=Sphingomonas sp. TaxID=28214 RepID=UPI002D810D68|nr:hypothetical protein [Sphingomonas sp.]HEU0042983.1 hypothetical protein [Sphingomonas sp.]